MDNKCKHNIYKDEPPQCLECGSFLCGFCLSSMRNDTGICESCLMSLVQLYPDELETELETTSKC